MYYCTNPDKIKNITKDEYLYDDDDYYVSSFYEIYCSFAEKIPTGLKHDQILLRRYTPEEDYMIHRMLGKHIINEDIVNKIIILKI